MAKIDFWETINELNKNSIGILRVSRDLYLRPVKRGTAWFVKSPVSTDKTWSLALKPETNSFTDFANCNSGGDIIRFVAYVRGLNNWQALKMLRNFYGLSNSQERNREDIRRQIYLERQAEQKRKARQHEFIQALYGHIDSLKAMEKNYQHLLQQEEIQANDEVSGWLANEMNMVSQKLDILCGISPNYRRMKPCIERGIPSDRPKWLLDVFEILKESDMFLPTKEEEREIQPWAEFEIKRKPGINRGCEVEW